MRLSKKILACVLAALMVITMMPFTASAVSIIAIAPAKMSAEYDSDDFESIFEAITEVEDGAGIRFTEDIVVDQPVVIPAGKSVKFNLNGHSLSGNIQDTDGKKLIQVSGELEFIGTLGGCIYNTNTDGQGHAACQALEGGIIFVNAPINFGDSDTNRTNANSTNRGCGIQNNGGTLIINDGYYTAIDANYSAGAWAYAILNCSGDTVVNNATVYGNGLHGALGCESGTLTVNDGTFAVNGSTNYYSLYVDGGVTTVNGGVFTNNGKYGVNYLGTGAETNINGGSFTYTVPFVVSGSKRNPVVSGGTFSGDVTAYLADGCIQKANGSVMLPVAQVNGEYYSDLEEAIAASNVGDTIKLVSDVDYTNYPRVTYHEINLPGRTLDLDGHTITGNNHSVVYTGDNFTIKNGTMNCVSDPNYKIQPNNAYGVVVYPENDDETQRSTGVVLENLTVIGGVNCWASDVTLKNLDVTGTTYYAIWADEGAQISVESGNYSSAATSSHAVIGSAKDDATSCVAVKGGNFEVENSGETLFLSGNRQYFVSGGSYHYENGNVYTVPSAKLVENYTQDMESGVVYQTEANTGASITVADKITANFYIDADYYEQEYTGQTVTATVTYNKNSNVSEEENMVEETIDLGSLPSLDDPTSAYDGAAKLSVLQAPAQATEEIIVTIYADDTVVEEISYSVYEYCKTIISSAEDAELVELAKTTLDYAAAAQEYFDYKTDNKATKANAGAYYGEVDEINLKTAVSDTISRPACIQGVTVVVKSDLEINLLSTEDINVTSATLYTDKGGSRFGASKAAKNGNYFVVHIAGIEPANMNKPITVGTTGGTVTLTANAVMRAMAFSSNPKMVTLANAMYLYGQAANAYFD